MKYAKAVVRITGVENDYLDKLIEEIQQAQRDNNIPPRTCTFTLFRDDVYVVSDTGNEYIPVISKHPEITVLACWGSNQGVFMIDSRLPYEYEQLKEIGILADVLDDNEQPTGEERCVLSVPSFKIKGYEI